MTNIIEFPKRQDPDVLLARCQRTQAEINSGMEELRRNHEKLCKDISVHYRAGVMHARKRTAVLVFAAIAGWIVGTLAAQI